jgi:hypothetical protein
MTLRSGAHNREVGYLSPWVDPEVTLHPLRVNGKPTTQEEIRVNADATLDAWPKASSVECGMAETILSLLDLLEANQDLVEHLTAPEQDPAAVALLRAIFEGES